MKKVKGFLFNNNLSKNNKRKFMLFPLLLFIVCFGFVIFTENVSADSLKHKTCIKRTSTYRKYTNYTNKKATSGYIATYINNDGHIVFCIESGVALTSSSGRSFKSYKLGDSTMNRGVGYAAWYVDSDGKASLSCSNRRVGGQIFTHMIAYYSKTKGSDFLSISDSALVSRVKSMISTSSSDETTIANHVVQIRTLYLAHGKKLSFKSYNSSKAVNEFDSCIKNDNGTYTCTKVLTESSGWLQKIQGLSDSRFHYSLTDVTSGTTVSRSGSKITVKAVIPAANINKAVQFSYTRSILSNSTIIKKAIVGGNVQDMAYMASPVVSKDKSTVKLYADIARTKVKVKKTLSTTGETLDGINLYLYDDEECTVRSKNYLGQTFGAQKTADGGLATWEGIIKDDDATYYVGENESKEYEKLCVPVKTVDYTETSTETPQPMPTAAEYVNTVQNVPKGVGTIEIQKTNKYTGSALRGMLFGIYSDSDCQTSATDADGKEFEEIYTDENGIAKWENIPYPSDLASEKIYYVKEIFSNESDTAGNGFAIEKDASVYANAKNYCIPVALKEKNKEFVKDVSKVLKINNHPYGNVTILKQDDKTGSSVKGAIFALYKSDGKTKAVDVDGKTIPNATTDSAGIAKFEKVPYGKYILREVQTPTGYKKLSKDLTFTLNDDLNSYTYLGQKIIGVNVEQNKTSYKLGDLNEDDQITSADLTLLKEWVEKISNSENVVISATQRYAADLNEDGVLDEADVSLMEEYVTNNNNKSAFKALKHGVFVLGEDTYALGDPNNDETVDTKDLEIARKIYLGEYTDYKEKEYYACDLNNDGTVNSQDIDLFEIYLGTGKIEEELAPQLTVDITKIDYNKDGKKDLKDIFFLKGVVFAKGGEVSDFTYDLNEDDSVNADDLAILNNYISNIDKEKAFNVITMEESDYINTINMIYKYLGKEIVDEPETTPSTGESESENTESTETTVPNSELEKYDYNKDKKIDVNDLASVKIDKSEYLVNYSSAYDSDNDGKVDAVDVALLSNMIAGIAAKDSTEFVYDINGDSTIDSIDFDLYLAYINGDKNLFEKVKITNDVNGDGKVDEVDLNTVKEAVANNKYSTNVDTNNDGEINSQDIISVKKAIGKFQEFSLLEQMVVSYNERVSLVVTNVPLDITLSKQAIANSKEIKGAKITIKDSKGKQIIEYVSSGKAQTFAIPAGTYTLTEKVAPAGYQKLTNTIKFKVGTDGNVTLLSAKSNLYKVKKTKTYGELDHLIIYNEPKTINAPNTGSVVSFIEILSGIALISVGGYVIYRKYKKA
ncbi:MAG: dockerin type I domain-containing protein [Bacilli bacterium]